MTGKWFAFSVLALSLGATGSYTAKAWATPPTPATPTLVQDRDDHWDAPPEEFRDVQRQGFHDGIDAARKDFDHHRESDVDHHDSYRHPHVDRSMREDYRDGFRRRYDKAMHHLREGGEQGH